MNSSADTFFLITCYVTIHKPVRHDNEKVLKQNENLAICHPFVND